MFSCRSRAEETGDDRQRSLFPVGRRGSLAHCVQGDLTVELTRAYLARIERLNGTLHAYVRVLHDEALTAARIATEEISAGNYRGPLHGVPIGLKDIYDTAGVPTEGG